MAALAFALAAMLTRYLCSPRSLIQIPDHPNERSLHDRVVPRAGGVAILAAGTVAVGLPAFEGEFPGALGWIGGAAGLIAAVSYCDDLAGLATGMRLVVHVLAAAVLLPGGIALTQVTLPGAPLVLPQALLVGVAILFTVWMTNLYNFMDGMDGLAGGMAVIGFATFALFGWRAGHESFAAVSLTIAAASAGFLVFNFPPARIFMGDVGSSTLGFLAGALSLWGAREGVFPLWVAVLVFSPFVVDATLTLFRRLLRGERIWQAHRTHYYQRLVRLGWGHRKTVLWEYLLMLACAGSALWAVDLPPVGQWALILVWASVYAALGVFVSRLEQASKAHAPIPGP